LLSLEKSFFERSQWIVIALSSPLSQTRRHVGLVYWQLFSNLFPNVVEASFEIIDICTKEHVTET
jgi:hypothetical protein